MPLRTGHTYTTSRGTYNTRKRTFTGKGKVPAGMRKVRAPKPSEVPTVTTGSGGKVTASGFSSNRAASRAVRRQEAARARVRRVTHLGKPSPQKVSQRVKPVTRSVRYAAPKPSPTSKPTTFEGHKTAGAPTLAALQQGSKSGALKVNRKGFVTTPEVRKVSRQLRQVKAKVQKATGPLPGLGPAESHVARKVLRTGKQEGATKKELLAAAETGLVESGFKNLGYGDADSEGWRQERTSIYGTGPGGPRNVKAGAKRFFAESVSDTGGSRGAGMTAGQLAQAIQGSAYPERYDERKPEAAAILHAFQKGSLSPKDAKRLGKLTAKAQRLGLKGLAGGERVTKRVMTRYKAALTAAKQLEHLHLPYVWGGGHNAGDVQIGSGVDCSGAVSYVLQKMGVKLPGGVVSGDMGRYLEPGPGAVTVFYNPEHTFMRIGGKYFGTSESNPAGGAGFISRSVAEPEALSGKYSVGHVPGLGQKVAVQMGVPLNFPGMTFSSSQTTATITGEATTQGKPGFSSRPIRLTRAEKAERTFKQLESLGVIGGEAKGSQRTKAASEVSIADLERKYSKAA